MGGVLIVEDELDIRQDVAEVLRDEGYEVSMAANGAEALARLRAGFEPCLILLDVMMPVMNGVEFRAEQVKEPSLASFPVFLVSGDGSVRQKAADLNAVGYLVKPFRLNDLLTAVARFCHHPEASH